MKKIIYILFLLAIVSVSCTHEKIGCQGGEEAAEQGKGKGLLSLSLACDRGVETYAGDKADYASIDTFRVELYKKEGNNYNQVNGWPHYKDIPSTLTLEVGEYKLAAHSLDEMPKISFEKPYYYGESFFAIEEGKLTGVSVRCPLANAMVGVEYTQSFKDFFTGKDYRIIVRDENRSEIVFTMEETRPVYIKPAMFSVALQYNGKEIHTETVSSEEVFPRDYHVVTLDY
ncbi:MAG TPA: DUF4493 domain-containing protein [Candidatus Avirikenella pullistercoris]|nr:DUF4493 domain-containing protein [Candidatus Avirikenella pullistercoris]